ncbi:YchF/TatD family DNA exonuclease [Buchnera aphidicola (Hyadaphis tataricae)]|uniref:YchF/TatD family DNA exonuclease n=1 Tax=Buchnera aphidicola (Hyadaphis tataricae) TaxID=1241859 RepID=A0A4D6XZP1_9GAMM|nr:YchF/TatD family DNA exonuclease [Buchnera aphidicola]QCI21649.1 YchF/TatD family DNA exonuclease [Buchnera aphidicola (Hyadaphis tataricae)]
MFLTDSHCHIDKLNYHYIHKNIEDVLKKSYEQNVKSLLTVSTSIKNFYHIQKLFKQYHSIFYSCGVHPVYCQRELKKFLKLQVLSDKITELSSIKRVIALGETGLDYYYSTENKHIQQTFFREHIRIAIKLKKPIIVHSRNAIHDTIKILKEENAQICKGILHSFTEDYNAARKLLDMGFYISFSGIITFKNSTSLQETIKKIPLSSLLIETDSPYLSPVPYRGQENQPAYLFNIAEYISSLINIDLKKLAETTTNNFRTLFNLKA